MTSYGFDYDHVPKWAVPKRVMHKTLPGTFPTEKAVAGFVRTRLPLMMDGLFHLDTDPFWARISPYPIEIEYHSATSDGNVVVRNHIPDIGVESVNGKRVYIDYVPRRLQEEWPNFEAEKEELGEIYWRDHGISYAVHDERCIYIQPRFSNLQIMWRHKIDAIDPVAVMEVKKAVHNLPLPTTIAQVRSYAALPALQMVWEHTDAKHRQNLDGVDRAFSAIMQLAMNGEIRTDLSKPFSDTTIVDRYDRGGRK